MIDQAKNLVRKRSKIGAEIWCEIVTFWCENVFSLGLHEPALSRSPRITVKTKSCAESAPQTY